MTSKTSKTPTGCATGGVLGNVDWQDDAPEIANRLPEVQTNFVTRRGRVTPGYARLVAEIIFDRRAV